MRARRDHARTRIACGAFLVRRGEREAARTALAHDDTGLAARWLACLG